MSNIILKDTTVHMMVKNGAPYIRQSLSSVAPYVERVIVTDTGSTDLTIKYIHNLQHIYSNIELYISQVNGDSINWDGNHLSQALTDIRNKMLDQTKTKWIWQVDDDEIYTKNSILTLTNALEYISDSKNNWVKGLMVKIKWCISHEEYVDGPFPKTLRIFQNGGRWMHPFPNEFYYIDGQPIFINDIRCQTVRGDFLHMSLKLHPDRRPQTGMVHKLTDEESKLLEWSI